MSIYNENLGNRILELLNYPIVDRCPELSILFERCTLRELQEIFPTLINSIFGINSGCLGWGLRTVNKEKSSCPQIFDLLYNFFGPLGPMFRLCYRLLNDAIKFDFNIEMLPHKLTEMLQSGHYSMFYADLLNVDPFLRCITSLSLNAFDYFMVNFIIHGTFPLHKMYPAALEVHNDRVKTVYFFLTADYLCTFLPSNPDAVVMPSNICGTVKAPQPMPVQQLQPTRSPKYLKLGPISHYTASNQSAAVIRAPESPRAHCWRSESIMYLFVDAWLRYDVDEAMELPSSEFIRVVRILVKQLHAFGNSADYDPTSMNVLRKMAQPMMKQRIYPFLKSIIARWPLDSSLSVVLELWLSYIQPWRYTFDRSLYNSNINVEIPITKFDGFIAENLSIYTQIFIQILHRFERLDFTSFRNVVMLHRLVKVFTQSTLPEILCDCELRFTKSKYPMSSHHTSPTRNSPYFSRPRAETFNEWETFRSDHYLSDDSYIPMFGENIKSEIYQLIKTVCVARMYVIQEVTNINHYIAKKNSKLNFIKKIIMSLFDDLSPEQIKLQEIQKIPEILHLAINSLSDMFEIDLPDVHLEHIEPSPKEMSFAQTNFTLGDESDNFDLSRITPFQMKYNIGNIRPAMDPALLPIQTFENTFLARSLHKISCKLNEMFTDEIQNLYNREDLWGKISRQVLYPPIIVKWFEKSKGVVEMRENCLNPRICLRVFSSYKTLFSIFLSILFGKLFCGSSFLGIYLLAFLTISYICILAIAS